MRETKFTDKKGFTLIELMVSMAIIGVLAATSVPVMRAYALKARQLELELTMKHLMDGMETHYLDTDELYPEITSSIIAILNIAKGEAKTIPELSYILPAGHKNQYQFIRVKFPWNNLDIALITINTDFDYDRNGMNDYWQIRMYIQNGQPMENNYREMNQIY